MACDDSHRTVSQRCSFLLSLAALTPIYQPLSEITTSSHYLILPPPTSHCWAHFAKPGIESRSRYESGSTCQRNSSPSRKSSKARLGKGVGRSQRKSDRRQVAHQLILSAMARCSEFRWAPPVSCPENSGRCGRCKPISVCGRRRQRGR